MSNAPTIETHTNKPLGLASVALFASALGALLVPQLLGGAPSLQLFALQLLLAVGFMEGGFFAAVAAAGGLTRQNRGTPETEAPRTQAGRGREKPSAKRHSPAPAANSAVPTAANTKLEHSQVSTSQGR